MYVQIALVVQPATQGFILQAQLAIIASIIVTRAQIVYPVQIVVWDISTHPLLLAQQVAQ